MSTCVWLVNHRRTDSWAHPGEVFRSVCGAKARYESDCGPLCSRHAHMKTAPNPKRIELAQGIEAELSK